MNDAKFITIELEADLTEESAREIIRAVSMIRGVLTAHGPLVDVISWRAYQRAKSFLCVELDGFLEAVVESDLKMRAPVKRTRARKP